MLDTSARRGDAAVAPFLHAQNTLGGVASALDVDLPAGLFESAFTFGPMEEPRSAHTALLVLIESSRASKTIVSATPALVCTTFGANVGQQY